MKGATAELWAKITSAPNNNNMKIIGVSHHHFLSQKKSMTSFGYRLDACRNIRVVLVVFAELLIIIWLFAEITR
jgi:hypothetical protein